ncbi:MAG: histidine phosphatase family protein [Pseudomonadota bacterium]
MTRLLRYLTHTQVVIDPDVAIDRWPLNQTGRARLEAARSAGWLRTVTRILSSTETKAVQSADILAEALDMVPEAVPGLHENDRSATGFLPSEEFERTADTFFAAPDRSVRGWETARDAQSRMVKSARPLWEAQREGDLLLVGHGAVGSLLWCHLADLPISRDHDQRPGGGCVWTYDLDAGAPRHGWLPVEEMED